MKGLSIAVWVSLFFGLAYFTLPKYELEERLRADALGTIQSENLSRLWFSPTGQLVGLGQLGPHLTVHVWDGRNAAPLRMRDLELPANPIFAVADDASKIAWIAQAGVHVENVFPAAGKVAADHPFRRRLPISSLALVASGELAALYPDGELDLWNITRGALSASKPLSLAEPGPLLASGSYLAAYSLLSHDVFVFDTGSGGKLSVLEYTKYPPDMLSMTLSPLGRLAAGTRDKVHVQGIPIAEPGPVTALAFADRDHVMVGGDFPGIFRVNPGQGIMQATGSQAGTTLVAATPSLLAFGNNRTIGLYSHRVVQARVYKGLSMPTPWLALALLGLLSPLAIPLFQGPFRALWKKIISLLFPEKETKTPISGQDDGIPGPLADACRNWDCVLYAGAGLSAQAGLPLWNECVRRIVAWTSQYGLASANVADSALAELSSGQTGAAADRLAEALEAQPDALHNYLRQRFRVTTELSAAHQLIKQIDFPALLTTNFDNLLDRTFPYSGGRVYTARDCEALAKTAARRDFFILKPFGDLEEPDTVRLGPAQCGEAIQSNPACCDFIEQLLQLRTFLFIGASLEGIEADLGYLALQAPIERKHYALIPDTGNSWKATAERLGRRYGIQVLTYTPSSPSHPEVVDFLNKLYAATRERASSEKHLTTTGTA